VIHKEAQVLIDAFGAAGHSAQLVETASPMPQSEQGRDYGVLVFVSEEEGQETVWESQRAQELLSAWEGSGEAPQAQESPESGKEHERAQGPSSTPRESTRPGMPGRRSNAAQPEQ
jgi:hypothetical protein